MRRGSGEVEWGGRGGCVCGISGTSMCGGTTVHPGRYSVVESAYVYHSRVANLTHLVGEDVRYAPRRYDAMAARRSARRA
jgi:hypothetical protein